MQMKKTILITGASRGIGKSTAYIMAENGYDLLLVSRNEEALISIKEDIVNNYKVDVRICALDISDKNELGRLEDIIKEINGVYALINNAAVSYVGLLTDMTYEEWDYTIDVNLNAAVYISKMVIPNMIKNKEGRIINISSMWGNVGASMEVAYSASKGGINAFTKALAKELAPSNIKVNAIAFGVINTDMNKNLSEDELLSLKNDIPMDRIAEPNEAAMMILNVLNAPSYMTGQVISMDGGFI